MKNNKNIAINISDLLITYNKILNFLYINLLKSFLTLIFQKFKLKFKNYKK